MQKAAGGTEIKGMRRRHDNQQEKLVRCCQVWDRGGWGQEWKRQDGAGASGTLPHSHPCAGRSRLPVHSQSSPIPFPGCSQPLPCASVAGQESPDLCPALRQLLDSEGTGLGCHNGSSFPWIPGAPRLRLRINPGLDDVLVPGGPEASLHPHHVHTVFSQRV